MAKKKAKLKHGDIAQLKWLDSCGPRRYWQDEEDMKRYFPLRCLSVGIVVKMDDESVVIAQSYGDDEVGNVMAIPVACITSIKVLSKATPRRQRGVE